VELIAPLQNRTTIALSAFLAVDCCISIALALIPCFLVGGTAILARRAAFRRELLLKLPSDGAKPHDNRSFGVFGGGWLHFDCFGVNPLLFGRRNRHFGSSARRNPPRVAAEIAVRLRQTTRQSLFGVFGGGLLHFDCFGVDSLLFGSMEAHFWVAVHNGLMRIHAKHNNTLN
jgi:hypothetical protein